MTRKLFPTKPFAMIKHVPVLCCAAYCIQTVLCTVGCCRRYTLTESGDRVVPWRHVYIVYMCQTVCVCPLTLLAGLPAQYGYGLSNAPGGLKRLPKLKRASQQVSDLDGLARVARESARRVRWIERAQAQCLRVPSPSPVFLETSTTCPGECITIRMHQSGLAGG